MNPNSILARDVKPPVQPLRRPQAARVEFQLPRPAAEPDDRKAPAAQTRMDRSSRPVDRPGKNPAEIARGNEPGEPRGSERSQEVPGETRTRKEQAVSGKAPGRGQTRADEASARNGSKEAQDAASEASGEVVMEASIPAPSPAEAAALELLAMARSEIPDGAVPSPERGEAATAEEAADQDQPAALQEIRVAASPPQSSLVLPQDAVSELKPPIAGEKAEAGVITGEGRGTTTRPTPQALPLNSGEATKLTADQASAEEADAPAPPAGDLSEAAAKPPAEAASTPARPVTEPKAETSQGQPQPASVRFEALPPGLAALPENARALQAQLPEAGHAPGQGAHSPQRPPASPPTSLSALPIEIGFRALEGTKRFDIRLDPAELGRVDVSLSFDKDGEVTAKLTVDRVETLHLLQRDAKTLERAFDQAGLRTSDAGVQISLSDRNAGQGGGFQPEQDRDRTTKRRDDAEPVSGPVAEIIPSHRLRIGGVDLNI